LVFPSDDRVLIGADTADDAGVYKISEELALIQTLDFFPPVVDDPYDFGRIAAANALSDVYAMGGTPKTAMNIVAFPAETMDLQVLREILGGGIDKLREAETVLLGGHTIVDTELKYGLSVTGFVHPRRILANRGLRVGDCLLLTKPLGVGIVNTAVKAGLAERKTIERVTEQMATLNLVAAQVMRAFTITACTDVTGFGLLGHLAEMIAGTGTRVRLDAASVPYIAEARDFAAIGMVPAGAYRNRDFRRNMVVMAEAFDPLIRDILFDPQTSGGLLIGCPEKEAPALARRLIEEGVEEAAIIGRVVTGEQAIEVI
jgi:selenide, water dikinase